jgi:2-polyprenyl-6-methoxyphenol hydroxylase-like FAD-dependent oxidoreductase
MASRSRRSPSNRPRPRDDGAVLLWRRGDVRLRRPAHLPQLADSRAPSHGAGARHRHRIRHKFSHVVSEDERAVTFAFADGRTETAALLIGADGIHSKVLKYISPDIVPLYSGFLGVTYAFPRANLRFPQDTHVPFPVSIHSKAGAYVLAPQNPDGQEMFAGRQFVYPMQDRSGWDALLKDKSELVETHQRDMAAWASALVRSGQEQASSAEAHSFNLWPFHTLPKLPAWASARGRVVVLGDAAHAIPPTARHGPNQAFEDGYGLALLLRSLLPSWAEADLSASLRKWCEYR